MILLPAPRETLLQLMPKNGVVCEIGVAEGEFSQNIIDHTSPQKLHLIDPWVHQEREDYAKDANNVSNEEGNRRFNAVSTQFQSHTAIGQVEIHRAFSYDVADEFPDNYFDWIYVDAVHSYEGAKEDLLRFLPKVKQDGFIFGHDYTNHIHAREMDFGVVEAVDEFCIEQNMFFIALTNESYPSFILSRSENNHATQMLRSHIFFNFPQITEIIGHPKHTKMALDYFEVEGKVGINTKFLPRN